VIAFWGGQVVMSQAVTCHLIISKAADEKRTVYEKA
jgi:hypothetical protein